MLPADSCLEYGHYDCMYRHMEPTQFMMYGQHLSMFTNRLFITLLYSHGSNAIVCTNNYCEYYFKMNITAKYIHLMGLLLHSEQCFVVKLKFQTFGVIALSSCTFGSDTMATA